MRKVEAKRKHLESLDAKGLKQFLKTVPIPTVLAKHDRHFVIDHHHLARVVG